MTTLTLMDKVEDRPKQIGMPRWFELLERMHEERIDKTDLCFNCK